MRIKEYPMSLMTLWRRSFTYKDIGLVPYKLSEVDTRDNVNISCNIPTLVDASMPVMIAPMEKVVGVEFAAKVLQEGIPVVLPRSDDFEHDIAVWNSLASICTVSMRDKIFFSVPATSAKWKIDALLDRNIHPVKFCIDVANGYSKIVKKALEDLHNYVQDFTFITGNVASIEGYEFLAQLGVHGVRCGIGGGSVCTTSLATGIGVGQASLIRELAEYKDLAENEIKTTYPSIIADGGIKSPGDLCKAIALGADIVMAGGIFAGTEETPGKVMVIDGQAYKSYAGQASMAIKGNKRYVEGAEKLIKYKGPVMDVINALREGLRSSMSYMGCETIEAFRNLPENAFVLLSEAAQYERTPHAE